ncbi:MAG: hypothetical protein KAU41_09750 [Deltaproteobacteria bacterium]|nr:hypothetical protein [Deltaproteobacteria bacterium]
MQRTTVMLPHELKIKALNRANIQGISLGQFIRNSLLISLENLQKNDSVDDPLFADDAVYHGKTPADLAKNHDNYIYGE